MSGGRIWLPKGPLGRHRALAMAATSGFSPTSVSAIAGWLRVAQASDAGSGLAFTLPDVINPANPATQTTDARKPTIGTDAGGLPRLTFTDDVLLWPLSASINNDGTKWGIAFWGDFTSDATERLLFQVTTAGGAASNTKVNVRYSNTYGLAFDVLTGGNTGRMGTMVPLTGKHFYTIEYDGGQATNATKVIITIDSLAQSLTFTNFGLAAIPSSINTPTGNILIGAGSLTGGSPAVGSFGANIWPLLGSGGISGGGLLTASERTNLMAVEAMT
jgi:hypothetical protein